MSKDIFEKTKNKPKKPWYMVNTKNYQIPLWALPIAPIVIGVSKLSDWFYDHIKWDERKATKVLNHVLPKILDYDKDEDAYYYCMDWGTYILWHEAPLRYRRFVYKYEFKLHSFIKDKYMAKGYCKSIINDDYEEWVEFRPIGFKVG
nr:MAG TPA: hypothetical protein [Herelleviridae sp.]